MEWQLKKLEKIVGGKVSAIITDKDEEFFGLRIIQSGKIFNMWIMCDEEGNGPGAVEINEDQVED